MGHVTFRTTPAHPQGHPEITDLLRGGENSAHRKNIPLMKRRGPALLHHSLDPGSNPFFINPIPCPEERLRSMFHEDIRDSKALHPDPIKSLFLKKLEDGTPETSLKDIFFDGEDPSRPGSP